MVMFMFKTRFARFASTVLRSMPSFYPYKSSKANDQLVSLAATVLTGLCIVGQAHKLERQDQEIKHLKVRLQILEGAAGTTVLPTGLQRVQQRIFINSI